MNKRLLSAEDIIALLEEKCSTRVWYICGVGKGAKIEGTEFNEIWIMVYNKRDLKNLRAMLEGILNITEISYTGHPKPASFNVI